MAAVFPSIGWIYDNHKFMTKSITDNQKKKGRGRPATGITPMTGVRLSDDTVRKIEMWARKQPDTPTRAEAIRRLVELGLDAGEMPAQEPGSRAKHAAKAARMAGQEIDRRGDRSASVEERARRKRRLIKGPSEFREMRGRKPKD